jgi:kinesin family protein 2/24
MIANISPAASSADHTLNTLRYADRIKEQTVGGQAAANRAANNKSPVPAPAPLSTAVKAAVQPPKVPQLAAEPKAVGKALSVVGAQAKLTVERKENYDNKGEVDDFDDADTAEHIFEEEEALLNLHMNIIQENAELLTEEGRLLQQIQCDDSDIDGYAARLETILRRKQSLIEVLQQKLSGFRQLLQVEENVFRSTMT